MISTEICECGHTAEEHHRSWYIGGAESIEECEAFGFNETSGQQLVDGQWQVHCLRFQLRRD